MREKRDDRSDEERSSRGSLLAIEPRDTMSRQADVRGMSLMNATDVELHRVHAALGASLQNGTLRPVVGSVLPLRDGHAIKQRFVAALNAPLRKLDP